MANISIAATPVCHCIIQAVECRARQTVLQICPAKQTPAQAQAIGHNGVLEVVKGVKGSASAPDLMSPLWADTQASPINLAAMASTPISMASNPNSDGLQPRSNGLHPTSDDIHPNSNGLQPT